MLMSRLLSNNADHGAECDFGAEALHIRGEIFRNSAAKFWSSLADEISADYPACTRLAMSGLTDARLSRETLFPGAALQADDDLFSGNIPPGEALRRAMAELELFGLPGAVRIRLFDSDREILSLDLPCDCVDADILPYLLAWLLEWSGAPDADWDAPRAAGAFAAWDSKRRVRYGFDFQMTSKHVCEGLFERAVDMRFKVERGDTRIGKQSGYEVIA